MVKERESKSVLVVGDSFVEGVGDALGGWVTRLQGKGFRVIKSGIGGDTSQKLLGRIHADLGKDFDLALLQIGTNDSRYRPSLAAHEVPLDEFILNVRRIVAMLQARAERVYVLGLTTVDESMTTPYKEDKFYRNSDIQLYNDALRQTAIPATYIPLPRLADREEALSDGLHPSSLGHQLILEAVLAKLCLD